MRSGTKRFRGTAYPALSACVWLRAVAVPGICSCARTVATGAGCAQLLAVVPPELSDAAEMAGRCRSWRSTLASLWRSSSSRHRVAASPSASRCSPTAAAGRCRCGSAPPPPRPAGASSGSASPRWRHEPCATTETEPACLECGTPVRPPPPRQPAAAALLWHWSSPAVGRAGGRMNRSVCCAVAAWGLQ